MHTITTGDESMAHTISPREDQQSPIHKQEDRQSPHTKEVVRCDEY